MRPITLTKSQIIAIEDAERSLVARNFTQYLRLKALINDDSPQARTEFRRVFKSYYGMTSRTGASQEFDDKFFEILFHHVGREPPDFSETVRQLADVKTPRGVTALQFSFVSKLIAIHCEKRPIYDVHVRSFFNERATPSGMNGESRIAHVREFLEFVADRYTNWAPEEQVARILERVRDRVNGLRECDSVRLFDFLVWRLGNLKRKTATLKS